jgi:hypothetical protein
MAGSSDVLRYLRPVGVNDLMEGGWRDGAHGWLSTKDGFSYVMVIEEVGEDVVVELPDHTVHSKHFH